MFGAVDHAVQLIDDMIKQPGLWPLVEIIILSMFLLGMVHVARRANRDRGIGGALVEIPSFLLNGPLHDAMQEITDNAEESRKITASLKEIRDDVEGLDRGQRYTHELLEAILRNQEMRPDSAATIPPTHRHPRKPAP